MVLANYKKYGSLFGQWIHACAWLALSNMIKMAPGFLNGSAGFQLCYFVHFYNYNLTIGMMLLFQLGIYILRLGHVCKRLAAPVLKHSASKKAF